MTPREAPSFEGEATMADRRDSRIALRFIILIGILSFFADFAYEGSRSIVGPYLATLQELAQSSALLRDSASCSVTDCGSFLAVGPTLRVVIGQLQFLGTPCKWRQCPRLR
jgi:hypothetical protein